MGLRGPGAKPVAKKAKTAPAGEKTALAWTQPGLSRADRVIAWLEHLVVTSGPLAGQKMQVPEYQRRMTRDIYRTDDSGKRMVRQALLTLPRRNGKSFLTSALTLCHLAGPEAEPRGLCVSAACDRAQSAIIFEEMKAFIAAEPDLSGRIIVRDFRKELEDVETGSIYRALSSDARKAHGLGPSFFCADETSQWLGRELFDGLVSGMGARREPLGIVISTRSADPLNLTEELVDYGQKVNAGIIDDPSFVAHIHSAPLDADWTDPEVWKACNPAVEAGWLDLDDLRIACEQAQRIPARESSFKLLRLNMPVEADERFIHASDWDALGQPFAIEELKGKVCYAALDLGSAADLCGLALWFPDENRLLAWGFLPDAQIDAKERTDRAPYRQWVREGLLIATPGRAIDKRWIAEKLREIAADYDLAAVAFDRWGFKDLEVILNAEGISLPLRPHGQGFKDLGPSVEELERLVLQGRLHHGGNPLLRWCLSNVAVETDPTGAKKPAKNRSRGRIDPLVAAIMAVGQAAREPRAPILDFSDMVMLV
jgi:phage terminase large subunit-like protein